jgi:predicted Rossmann fold flavoprotein
MTRSLDYDLAVIGAGAAGLTAAIFARRAAPEARIVALDGAPKIGAKILISGGGRCNVTHDGVTPEDFNGSRNAIAKVLRTFPVAETIEWFRELGVELKREETGKLFPTTDRARTVLEALLRACEGVEIRTNARVLSCHPERSEGSPERDGFLVSLGMTQIRARSVVLCAGGKSVPKTGSDGSGYDLARMLGHSVTHVFPALVPLIVDAPRLTALSGTSTEAELSVLSESGRVLARQRGSLLFTHFGISGPVALDISRHWIAAQPATLVANVLIGETFESVEEAWLDEAQRNPRATVASLLRGRLPERLLTALAGEPAPLSKITKEERRRIIRALVALTIPVVRDRGFDFAEVTAGGVPLTEIELATMHSRKREGLYLCGEILDVDGRIGGYNFQWAWASGRLAGLSAASALLRR